MSNFFHDGLSLVCQVVELEIQLDEIREQYNNVIRNSNSKAQQKKMAFLERNLEQLTLVQKQVSGFLVKREQWGWSVCDESDLDPLLRFLSYSLSIRTRD